MARILIIENEIVFLEEIMSILQFEGFEVIGADNGRRGIELAKTDRPDMIICDIGMPEVDGYGVLAIIRDNPSIAETPFIFLTAKAAQRDQRKALEMGATDYLIKPFSTRNLLSKIRTYLNDRD